MAKPDHCVGGKGWRCPSPLLTGAKWCHAVPLSDHLSARLASTQVIKVSCPSCEIKGHITKGQFGSMFNHIYCCCITGSLFSLLLLAAEGITRMLMEENNKSFYFGIHPTPLLAAHQVPSVMLILNDGCSLFLVWLSPRYVSYSSRQSLTCPSRQR